MPDREKVIKGIDICLQRFHCGEDCPYNDDCGIGCMEQLREDTLALLKEQEPVQPERECSGGGTTWWNVCGACRTAINPNDKYCHECGKPILWNGGEAE